MERGDLTAPLVGATSTLGAPKAKSGLQPGSTLGRYVVVERLGSGTGGTVYAAYDSHLGRRIALKVLGSTGVDPEAPSGLSGPLLREAQLIAGLDHPNIVTVHDIGHSRGHTFIAMELVSGQDLAAWLRKYPPDGRRWRRRLRPWLLAGRGLAAAHASGVIHGDFKPANVLLGDDGRVRVTDLGVGRLSEAEPSVQDSGDPDAERLWGTPVYMAPELFDGRPPDRRSDLYSFSASVYEALYGVHPSRGGDMAALLLAKQEVPEPEDERGVPSAVLELLRVGLEPDPEARATTVAELVAALERRIKVRRRRWLAVGATAGLAAVTWGSFAASRNAPQCRGARVRLQGVWDAPRRAEAEAAFGRAELAYGETAWRRFAAQLDQYAAGWTSAYIQVCESSSRGEQSDALLDAKMACLSRRRAAMVALVTGVAEGTPERLVKSGEAAERLEPVQPCVDLTQQPDALVPPEEIRREVEAIDELLVAVQTGLDLGESDDALAIATEALARAEQAGFRPLIARAQFALGRARSRTGDYAAAKTVLEQSALLAEEVGDDRTAARAGLMVMYTHGVGMEDWRTALSWAPHTEVALKRGHVGPRTWARFHDYRSYALEDLGRRDEAVTEIGLSIDDWRSVDSEFAAGEVARREARLMMLRGDLDGAAKHQRDALQRIEEVAGWPHPDSLEAASMLATYLDGAGHPEEAVVELERTVDGARASHGDDHPVTLTVQANLAAVLTTAGRPAEALDHYARVREGVAKTLGKDHSRYAGILANIAASLGSAGRHEEAAKVAEEAVGPIVEHFGPKHRITGYIYSTLGAARRRTGDAAGAVEAYEQTLAILLEQPEGPGDAATTQFELAQALVESGGDPERARRLASSAQKAWTDLGEQEQAATVTQWIQAL